MTRGRCVALAVLGCYSTVQQCGQAFVFRPRLSVGHVTKATIFAHTTRRHPQARRTTFKPLLASPNNNVRGTVEERSPAAEEARSAPGRDSAVEESSWSGGVSTLAALAAGAAGVALLHPDVANAADAFGESFLHFVESTLLFLSGSGTPAELMELSGRSRRHDQKNQGQR